jgi:hypothetical protein
MAVPLTRIVKDLPAGSGTAARPQGAKAPEGAEHCAWGYARRYRRPVGRAVSRRRSVWINPEGEVEARTEAAPD